MEVCRARWDPVYLISGLDNELTAGPYSLVDLGLGLGLRLGLGLGLGHGLGLGLGFGLGLRLG
jgi:hypothetical protein